MPIPSLPTHRASMSYASKRPSRPVRSRRPPATRWGRERHRQEHGQTRPSRRQTQRSHTLRLQAASRRGQRNDVAVSAPFSTPLLLLLQVVVVVLTVKLMTCLWRYVITDAPNYGGRVPVDTTSGPAPVCKAIKTHPISSSSR